MTPIADAISGSAATAIPTFPRRVRLRTSSKAIGHGDRDADRDELLERERRVADVTAVPLRSAGNEVDVDPQISAARFSRISPTPSVLTSQAKLKRSNEQHRADGDQVGDDAAEAPRRSSRR